METGQKQGDADAGETPGPGQEEQQGVIEGGEDESRDGHDEPEEHGGEPGVQRQRRQEDRHSCLTHGYCLERQNSTGKYSKNDVESNISFTFKIFCASIGLSVLNTKSNKSRTVSF